MKTLILLIFLFPGLAFSGNLYRCVSQAGHVSYQSASCPDGQRTDRAIEFAPDAASALLDAKASNAAKRFASKSPSSPRQRFSKRRAQQPNICARAKVKRELQLQRFGLKRTYDDLSRVDAAVRVACNGG